MAGINDFSSLEITFKGELGTEFINPDVVTVLGIPLFTWVSWNEEQDTYKLAGQFFDEDATRLGGSIAFLPDKDIEYSYELHDFAYGGFFVVWGDSFFSPSYKAQTLFVDGTKIGDEYTVSTKNALPDFGLVSNITVLNNGNLVNYNTTISYTIGPDDGDPLTASTIPQDALVKYQVFDGNTGNILTEQSNAASQPDNFPSFTYTQGYPEAHALHNGGFIIVWDNGHNVAAREFAADGTPTISEFSTQNYL